MLTYAWIRLNAILTAIFWTAILILALLRPAYADHETYPGMEGYVPVEGAPHGPVNEGNWSFGPIAICAIFVPQGTFDPTFCQPLTDSWGPYPTFEMCDARQDDVLAYYAHWFTVQSGVPHWSMARDTCTENRPEGTDA